MDASQVIESRPRRILTNLLRLLVSFTVPVVIFLALLWSFTFMRDSEANRLAVGAVALVVGVGGVWALYYATDLLVSQFPESVREGVRPYVFVGPALVILTAYLIYPTINTLYLSFFDARGENFIGIDNYIFAFTDPAMLIVLRNNVFWLVLVTFFAVAMGLIIAVLVDRIRLESAFKALIFLPMAISAVGASVIWKFIYAFRPAGTPQIGILNAIKVALGGDPVGWLILQPWNNFFLIVVYIWLLTGFAMVVLSSAIKSVPEELIEAARIDGASEVRIFFSVTIPYIRGTLITITTTILIIVLKVFDIVFVMTSGQLGTDVIANRMFSEMFRFRNFGRGSALAVILLLAVTPVVISNIRSMRENR